MARILVADDDEVTRLSLGEELAASGHEVAYAANGEQAVSYYRKHPFDIVLMDLAMPVKNGLQAIRELYEHYRDVRIIAITDSDPENLPLAEEYGAMGSMMKPIETEKLLELIEQALQQSRGWEGVTD